MKVRVEFDSRCLVQLGDLDDDGEAMVIEYLRWLREQFETNHGLLIGRNPNPENGEGVFEWSDENWRVNYRRDIRGNLFSGDKSS